MKTGKPLWRVLSEPTKADKKRQMKVTYVVAQEMQVTPRGTRSNEWVVREIVQEKGWTVVSAMFLGFVSQVPSGAIDIRLLPEDEDKSTNKFKK